jgi:hypothetical protein
VRHLPLRQERRSSHRRCSRSVVSADSFETRPDLPLIASTGSRRGPIKRHTAPIRPISFSLTRTALSVSRGQWIRSGRVFCPKGVPPVMADHFSPSAGPRTASRTPHCQQDPALPAGPRTASRTPHCQQDPALPAGPRTATLRPLDSNGGRGHEEPRHPIPRPFSHKPATVEQPSSAGNVRLSFRKGIRRMPCSISRRARSS